MFKQLNFSHDVKKKQKRGKEKITVIYGAEMIVYFGHCFLATRKQWQI